MIAQQKYGINEEKLGNPAKTGFYTGLFRILGNIPAFDSVFRLNLPTSIALPISVVITLATLTLIGFLVAVSAEISVRLKITELIISGLVLTGDCIRHRHCSIKVRWASAMKTPAFSSVCALALTDCLQSKHKSATLTVSGEHQSTKVILFLPQPGLLLH